LARDSEVAAGYVAAPGSLAQGDVLYYNGSAWARLGAGTDGQFLKTQGAAANPAWDDVGGVASVGFVPTVYNATYAKNLTRFFAIGNGNGSSLNAQGIVLAGSGTAAAKAVTAGSPSAVRYSTTSASQGIGVSESSGGVLWNTRDFTLSALVTPEDSFSVIATNRIWFGTFTSSPSGSDTPANGAGFRFAPTTALDVNWMAYSNDANGNAPGAVSTGVAGTKDTTYLLSLVKTGTSIVFYVNGSSVLTNTFNPTGSQSGIHCLGSTGTGTSGATRGLLIHQIDGSISIP
jgi:hypothetical protein